MRIKQLTAKSRKRNTTSRGKNTNEDEELVMAERLQFDLGMRLYVIGSDGQVSDVGWYRTRRVGDFERYLGENGTKS